MKHLSSLLQHEKQLKILECLEVNQPIEPIRRSDKVNVKKKTNNNSKLTKANFPKCKKMLANML